MYRKLVLIWNPASGRRKSKRARVIAEAAAILRKHAAVVETRETGSPGSATGLAREAFENGADLIAVSGGDGTVNEAINGIAHAPVPLLVLPSGTANVLGVEIGFPLDPARAAALLPDLEPRRVSLGRVCRPGPQPQSRYFLLMAGIGMDARIVYNLSLRWKSYFGVGSYWMAAVGQMKNPLEPFEVEIGGRKSECTFALASRSRSYGGSYRIARHAHLLSDGLQVVLFHTRSSLRYLRYLAAMLSGTLEGLPDVTVCNVDSLTVRTSDAASRVYLQVDGEYEGRLPVTVEAVPDALTLLMPRAYIAEASKISHPIPAING